MKSNQNFKLFVTKITLLRVIEKRLPLQMGIDLYVENLIEGKEHFLIHGTMHSSRHLLDGKLEMSFSRSCLLR